MAKTTTKPSTNGKAGRHEMFSVLRELTSMPGVSRAAMAKLLAGGLGHDIDSECGYPANITYQMYRQMYDREGIASRVVSIYPTESWSVEPWIYETESMKGDAKTAFEKKWEELTLKFGLYGKLNRLDEISGIGSYGVLLMGFSDGGPLDSPVPGIDSDGNPVEGFEGKNELLFVMPFDEGQAQIDTFNKNPRSPRYGYPEYYSITTADPSTNQIQADAKSQKVHWSRVIHVADNCKTNDVFGTPRQKAVWNYLLNIRKTLGGAAEMFWNGGFPGISFEVPPEIAGEVDLDVASLTAEAEAYMSSMKRYLALQGVTAKSLASQIADPETHIDVQIMAICIAIETPRRVFMGTEEAKLASGQDMEAWNKRVHRRQNIHCIPKIIRPFVDRLMAVGVLPKVEKYFVKWPDLYSISQTDKADITGKLVRALGEYMSTGVSKLIPPLEFFTIIMDFTTDEAEEIIKAAEAAVKNPPSFITDPMEAEIEKAKALAKINPAGGMGESKPPRKGMGVRPTRKGVPNKKKPSTNAEALIRCMVEGKPGFKAGENGTCYTYTPGDSVSRKKAIRKSRLQGKSASIARRLQSLEEEG